ncbi:MAG: hypothetical protein JNG88_08050 [Phycisphaerales bacterium]|nr:hypothetical protein [Phycisphaerales bacterium]
MSSAVWTALFVLLSASAAGSAGPVTLSATPLNCVADRSLPIVYRIEIVNDGGCPVYYYPAEESLPFLAEAVNADGQSAVRDSARAGKINYADKSLRPQRRAIELRAGERHSWYHEVAADVLNDAIEPGEWREVDLGFRLAVFQRPEEASSAEVLHSSRTKVTWVGEQAALTDIPVERTAAQRARRSGELTRQLERPDVARADALRALEELGVQKAHEATRSLLRAGKSYPDAAQAALAPLGEPAVAIAVQQYALEPDPQIREATGRFLHSISTGNRDLVTSQVERYTKVLVQPVAVTRLNELREAVRRK